jgi:hypothetical protein
MRAERYDEIQALTDRFDQLPDGAFVAALAEHGVDVDDLVEFAAESDRRDAIHLMRTGRSAN